MKSREEDVASSETDEEERRERRRRRRKEREMRSDDYDEIQNDGLERKARTSLRETGESVWQVVAKRNKSPSHEDYKDFFTPVELLSKDPEYKQAVAEADADRVITAYEVPGAITIESDGFRDSRENPAYTFGPDGEEIDPSPIAPAWVPKLKLIAPTPQPSLIGSDRDDMSPTIKAEDNTEGVLEESPIPITTFEPVIGNGQAPEYTVIEPKGSRDPSVEEPPTPITTIEAIFGEGQAPEYTVIEPRGPRDHSADSGPSEKYSVDDVRGKRRAESQTPAYSMDPAGEESRGDFGDDPFFAATLAAGLSEAGFDPDIVVDNPSFVRRDSPPGSEEPGTYSASSLENVIDLALGPSSDEKDLPPQQGFIEGELEEGPSGRSMPGAFEDDTEHEEREPERKLNKKEKKRRAREARNQVTSEILREDKGQVDSGTDGIYASPEPLQAEQKSAFTEAEHHARDAASTAASAPDIDQMSKKKKSKKQSKRGNRGVDGQESGASAPLGITMREPATNPGPRDRDAPMEPLENGDTHENDIESVAAGPVDDFKISKKKDQSKNVKSTHETGQPLYAGGASSFNRDDDIAREIEPETEYKKPQTNGNKATRDSGRITQDLPAEVSLPASTGHDPRVPSTESLTNPEDYDYGRKMAKAESPTGPNNTRYLPELEHDTKDPSMSFLGMRREIPSPPDIHDKEKSSGISPPDRRSSAPLTSEPAFEAVSGAASLPTSPTRRIDGPAYRLSQLQHEGVNQTPLSSPSPTAIPFHFRVPLTSPGVARSSPSVPQTPSTTDSVPTRPKLRPRSTEFKSSSEIRPLWLVERHGSKQEPPAEETYPSLPSSHTTSRSSSVRDPDETESYSAEDLDTMKYQATNDQPNRSLFLNTTLQEVGPETGLLDSQQATPTAASFAAALKDSSEPNDNATGLQSSLESPSPEPYIRRLKKYEERSSKPLSVSYTSREKDPSDLKQVTLGAVLGATAAGALIAAKDAASDSKERNEDSGHGEAYHMEEKTKPAPQLELEQDDDNFMAASGDYSPEVLDQGWSAENGLRQQEIKTLTAEQRLKIEEQDTQDAVDGWTAPSSSRKEKKAKKNRRRGQGPEKFVESIAQNQENNLQPEQPAGLDDSFADGESAAQEAVAVQRGLETADPVSKADESLSRGMPAEDVTNIMTRSAEASTKDVGPPSRNDQSMDAPPPDIRDAAARIDETAGFDNIQEPIISSNYSRHTDVKTLVGDATSSLDATGGILTTDRSGQDPEKSSTKAETAVELCGKPKDWASLPKKAKKGKKKSRKPSEPPLMPEDENMPKSTALNEHKDLKEETKSLDQDSQLKVPRGMNDDPARGKTGREGLTVEGSVELFKPEKAEQSTELVPEIEDTTSARRILGPVLPESIALPPEDPLEFFDVQTDDRPGNNLIIDEAQPSNESSILPEKEEKPHPIVEKLFGVPIKDLKEPEVANVTVAPLPTDVPSPSFPPSDPTVTPRTATVEAKDQVTDGLPYLPTTATKQGKKSEKNGPAELNETAVQSGTEPAPVKSALEMEDDLEIAQQRSPSASEVQNVEDWPVSRKKKAKKGKKQKMSTADASSQQSTIELVDYATQEHVAELGKRVPAKPSMESDAQATEVLEPNRTIERREIARKKSSDLDGDAQVDTSIPKPHAEKSEHQGQHHNEVAEFYPGNDTDSVRSKALQSPPRGRTTSLDLKEQIGEGDAVQEAAVDPMFTPQHVSVFAGAKGIVKEGETSLPEKTYESVESDLKPGSILPCSETAEQNNALTSPVAASDATVPVTDMLDYSIEGNTVRDPENSPALAEELGVEPKIATETFGMLDKATAERAASQGSMAESKGNLDLLQSPAMENASTTEPEPAVARTNTALDVKNILESKNSRPSSPNALRGGNEKPDEPSDQQSSVQRPVDTVSGVLEGDWNAPRETSTGEKSENVVNPLKGDEEIIEPHEHPMASTEADPPFREETRTLKEFEPEPASGELARIVKEPELEHASILSVESQKLASELTQDGVDLVAGEVHAGRTVISELESSSTAMKGTMPVQTAESFSSLKREPELSHGDMDQERATSGQPGDTISGVSSDSAPHGLDITAEDANIHQPAQGEYPLLPAILAKANDPQSSLPTERESSGEKDFVHTEPTQAESTVQTAKVLDDETAYESPVKSKKAKKKAKRKALAWEGDVGEATLEVPSLPEDGIPESKQAAKLPNATDSVPAEVEDKGFQSALKSKKDKKRSKKGKTLAWAEDVPVSERSTEPLVEPMPSKRTPHVFALTDENLKAPQEVIKDIKQKPAEDSIDAPKMTDEIEPENIIKSKKAKKKAKKAKELASEDEVEAAMPAAETATEQEPFRHESATAAILRDTIETPQMSSKDVAASGEEDFDSEYRIMLSKDVEDAKSQMLPDEPQVSVNTTETPSLHTEVQDNSLELDSQPEERLVKQTEESPLEKPSDEITSPTTNVLETFTKPEKSKKGKKNGKKSKSVEWTDEPDAAAPEIEASTRLQYDLGTRDLEFEPPMETQPDTQAIGSVSGAGAEFESVPRREKDTTAKRRTPFSWADESTATTDPGENLPTVSGDDTDGNAQEHLTEKTSQSPLLIAVDQLKKDSDIAVEREEQGEDPTMMPFASTDVITLPVTGVASPDHLSFAISNPDSVSASQEHPVLPTSDEPPPDPKDSAPGEFKEQPIAGSGRPEESRPEELSIEAQEDTAPKPVDQEMFGLDHISPEEPVDFERAEVEQKTEDGGTVIETATIEHNAPPTMPLRASPVSSPGKIRKTSPLSTHRDLEDAEKATIEPDASLKVQASPVQSFGNIRESSPPSTHSDLENAETFLYENRDEGLRLSVASEGPRSPVERLASESVAPGGELDSSYSLRKRKKDKKKVKNIKAPSSQEAASGKGFVDAKLEEDFIAPNNLSNPLADQREIGGEAQAPEAEIESPFSLKKTKKSKKKGKQARALEVEEDSVEQRIPGIVAEEENTPAIAPKDLNNQDSEAISEPAASKPEFESSYSLKKRKEDKKNAEQVKAPHIEEEIAQSEPKIITDPALERVGEEEVPQEGIAPDDGMEFGGFEKPREEMLKQSEPGQMPEAEATIDGHNRSLPPESVHKRAFSEEVGPDTSFEEERALEPPSKHTRTEDMDPRSHTIAEWEKEALLAPAKKSKKGKKAKKKAYSSLDPFEETPRAGGTLNDQLVSTVGANIEDQAEQVERGALFEAPAFADQDFDDRFESQGEPIQEAVAEDKAGDAAAKTIEENEPFNHSEQQNKDKKKRNATVRVQSQPEIIEAEPALTPISTRSATPTRTEAAAPFILPSSLESNDKTPVPELYLDQDGQVEHFAQERGAAREDLLQPSLSEPHGVDEEAIENVNNDLAVKESFSPGHETDISEPCGVGGEAIENVKDVGFNKTSASGHKPDVSEPHRLCLEATDDTRDVHGNETSTSGQESEAVFSKAKQSKKGKKNKKQQQPTIREDDAATPPEFTEAFAEAEKFPERERYAEPTTPLEQAEPSSSEGYFQPKHSSEDGGDVGMRSPPQAMEIPGENDRRSISPVEAPKQVSEGQEERRLPNSEYLEKEELVRQTDSPPEVIAYGAPNVLDSAPQGIAESPKEASINGPRSPGARLSTQEQAKDDASARVDLPETAQGFSSAKKSKKGKKSRSAGPTINFESEFGSLKDDNATREEFATAGTLGAGEILAGDRASGSKKRSKKDKKNKLQLRGDEENAELEEVRPAEPPRHIQGVQQSHQQAAAMTPPLSPIADNNGQADTRMPKDMPNIDIPSNRDSAMHITDSPLVSDAVPLHRPVRDSGFQGTEASPVIDRNIENEEPSSEQRADQSTVSPTELEERSQDEDRGEVLRRGHTPIDTHDITMGNASDHEGAPERMSQSRSPPQTPPSSTYDGPENISMAHTSHDEVQEPSLVDSTTKERSSILFQSSPSTREEGMNQPTQQPSPLRTSEPPMSEKTPNPPARSPSNEEHQASHQSLFGGPFDISSEMPSPPMSPVGPDTSPSNRLDPIRVYSPEESPPHGKYRRSLSSVEASERRFDSRRRTGSSQRRVRSPPAAMEPRRRDTFSTDDVLSNRPWPAVDEDRHSVDLERSRSRTTDRQASGRRSVVSPSSIPSKPAEGDVRSFSGASVRSGESINAIIRTPPDQVRSTSGLSYRSGTPPLRRIDRSVSGDLREANRKSDAKRRAKDEAAPPSSPVASSSTYDPTKDKGKGKTKVREMADVYEGYGDVHGSPMSPTRPPSMRKRQSMQILDLENRLDQLVSENRLLKDAKVRAERSADDASQDSKKQNSALREAIETRDLYLRQKDEELHELRQILEGLQGQVSQLTEVNESLNASRSLADEHQERYRQLEADHAHTHEQWQRSERELDELRQQHTNLSGGMEQIVRHEISVAVEGKNAELRQVKDELEATKEQVRALQRQILESRSKEDVVVDRDEDYFDSECQKLCQHVQQWVLRFSKFSDMKACFRASEIMDEKVVDRMENAILDGSDVDNYLSDRVKRRDVFMSVVMTMVWDYIFTRYLFGMDREQRQKLKSLEKTLSEVGSMSAVHKWRATTLTLLARRQTYLAQRAQDTEAVVHEIYTTLSTFLPPPPHLVQQIQDSLTKVISAAVDLSIEMRTQRAEYIMLPPLQPEYDTNGDLARKVYFNASLMNERSGATSSNDALEAQQAVVRMVLFPLVVKKGDEAGDGDEQIVVCPAQVLTAPGAKDKKTVRVMSAEPTASYAGSDAGMGGMI